ncbi:hypothetical protein BMS3Abin04_01815 [bacterium BMS3Abin04]|nr:hypothetical protein BMS3Abin04_01815 [bacterium BMS3Abin04]
MIFMILFPILVMAFFVGLLKLLLKWVSILSVPAVIGMVVYFL